ncbi:MAG: tetratricopeptide repeat protein [Gemmataceae bacterium]
MNSPRPGTPVATLSPEQRRQTALDFERGSQLVAKGSYLAGLRLLRDCCRRDPGNLLFRQALRRAAKARFGNRPPRGWWAYFLGWPLRARLRAAAAAGRYLEVLRLGERLLVRNPWDVPTQVQMAGAAERLGLIDVAVWTLEQARQADPQAADLNRSLARLYEQSGNFTQAMAHWELVQKVAPQDEEASARLGPNQAPRLPTVEQLAAARAQVQTNPTLPTAYLAWAHLLREAGQLEDARTVLREGLPWTGNAFELTVELADLEIEPFRRDLALTDQRLRQQPNDAHLLEIQERLRREVLARELELHRLLADRHPTQLIHRFEIGMRLLRLGQLAEAVEQLKLVRSDPNLRGQALLALAHGFRYQQHLRLAQQHFEEALQCLPERRSEVLYELARCHAELGELPRAVDLAAEVVRLDPAHRDIATLMLHWKTQAAPVAE